MTGWSVDPPGGVWGLLAVAGALAPLLAIGPRQRGLTRGRRTLLVVLRSASLLLLLLVAARPALETVTQRKLPGTMLLLADRSRSMQVEDSLHNASRWSALQTALLDADAAFAELKDSWDVKAYTFAEDLQVAAPIAEQPGQFALPTAPEGTQTALGAAIDEALAREAQQRIVAVLLLSDGAQRAFAPLDLPPQTAVQRLAADGIPLYAFTFGQPSQGQQADLRIADLLASDTVFAETPMNVEGVLTANGYANQQVRVQLLWESADGKMEGVDARSVMVEAGKRRYPLTLEHVPTEPGEYKLTLQVESPEGELVTSNNEQSTFVTVRKGGVNILYLAGATRVGGGPSVEPRFVRSALAAHADFHVEYELINYRAREIDYRDRLRTGKYDVFLLGDLDVQGLTSLSWREMAARVENGAGLAMLGGFHSFGPGGYRGTPIEAALPIEMGRAERQNFDEPIRQDVHLQGKTRLVPVARSGGLHPILRIADTDDESLAQWRRLPPLEGANKLDALRLKPNAEPVAQADDASRSPLLVLGGWGEGRTAALAIDSTWLWRMAGFGDVQRRFWRQLVLWLAKKDVKSEQQAWIRLDQRRYQQGSRVDFAVGAADAQGEQAEDAEFDVRIEKPDGKLASVRTSPRGKENVASFAETAAGGVYRVIVSARTEGKTLGEATARFSVSDQDVELDQPSAEPSLMETLARQTASAGGGFYAPEQLPSVLADLQKKSQQFEEEIVERITLWDRWPTLLVLVATLSAEWLLRKRWGLT